MQKPTKYWNYIRGKEIMRLFRSFITETQHEVAGADFSWGKSAHADWAIRFSLPRALAPAAGVDSCIWMILAADSRVD